MIEGDWELVGPQIRELAGAVEVLLRGCEDDRAFGDLQRFAEQLCEQSDGAITLRVEVGRHDTGRLPELILAGRGTGRIHYSFVPSANEIQPFLSALRYVSGVPTPLSQETVESLVALERPANISVLVSPYCTNCPRVVEEVVTLALGHPGISARFLDVQLSVDIRERHGVKSVPATIIEDELVWIGPITVEDLVQILASRGTESYDGKVLRSFLERRRTAEAVELLSKGRARLSVLSLFQEPELSSRMGALLVLEETLTRDPGTIREMLPTLIDLLSHQDPRIRGDMAGFLGAVGDDRVKPHLERLRGDPDPDVAEAALDALRELRSGE